VLILCRRRQARDLTGPVAAFVLLGAYFACYHFMYYDTMLAALPLALLFANPGRFALVTRWRKPIGLLTSGTVPRGPTEISPPPPTWFVIVRGDWMAAFALRPRWWRNLLALVLLALLLASPVLFRLWVSDIPVLPWDTFFLLGLWLWCGWEVWRPREGVLNKEAPACNSSPAMISSGSEVGQLA
jgi:hypothetical protein